jgi:hypothetical protein
MTDDPREAATAVINAYRAQVVATEERAEKSAV